MRKIPCRMTFVAMIWLATIMPAASNTLRCNPERLLEFMGGQSDQLSQIIYLARMDAAAFDRSGKVIARQHEPFWPNLANDYASAKNFGITALKSNQMDELISAPDQNILDFLLMAGLPVYENCLPKDGLIIGTRPAEPNSVYLRINYARPLQSPIIFRVGNHNLSGTRIAGEDYYETVQLSPGRTRPESIKISILEADRNGQATGREHVSRVINVPPKRPTICFLPFNRTINTGNYFGSTTFEAPIAPPLPNWMFVQDLVHFSPPNVHGGFNRRLSDLRHEVYGGNLRIKATLVSPANAHIAADIFISGTVKRRNSPDLCGN